MRLAEAAMRGAPDFLRVERDAHWLYQRIPQRRGAPREGLCGVSDEQIVSPACDETQDLSPETHSSAESSRDSDPTNSRREEAFH